MSDLSFTSAYGTKTMTVQEAYSGLFLDVEIRSSHAVHADNPALTFRMNETDQQELLKFLVSYGEQLENRRHLAACYDQAIAWNEIFDVWDMAHDINEYFNYLMGMSKRYVNTAKEYMDKRREVTAKLRKIKYEDDWSDWGYAGK